MIHLIGNAHLDPAWMWPLEEGLEAFAATCRSALARIAEYPDLIFTCSSAAHYEYVEETDPALFSRIRDAVHAGSWCIVGGWWVEADCNLPSGEALIRQALLGQRYFASRFGKIATVGYNVDSFGHNANLPALLKGAGLEHYVFMRPEQHECSLESALFDWRSPSGVSVSAYRVPLHYSNHQYNIREKLRMLPEYPLYDAGRDWMLFFGVGNHGGGPTIEQLEQIRAERKGRKDIQLSDPERFFSSAAPSFVARGEMNPHAVGAYSAHALVKQLNRRSENALERAERMQVMRHQVLPSFEREDLTAAWKSLCLTQFHDLLGGVATREATEEAITLQREAISIAERSSRLERQRLASAVDTSRAVQNLIVFNDSAYERSEYIEFELWHPHASELGDILHAVTLEASDGSTIACQKIEPSGKIGEDRVRWLARVNAPSFGWGAFAVRENVVSSRPANVSRPLPRAKLLVARDAGDTWAHGITSYLPAISEFDVVRTVQIEEGPLRSATRVYLRYRESRAELEYLRYQDEAFTELRVMLDWHEPDETVLLAVPHGITDPTVTYEIPYATIDRNADGKEYPGQTWVDIHDPVTRSGLAVINDSKYSCSTDSECLYITLARSKPYAYHVPPHTLAADERTRYLDHGVQECRFLILDHDAILEPSELYRLSQRLNMPLAVHHESSHAGVLPASHSLIQCEPKSVRVGAIKPAEEGEGVILRLVELDGHGQHARIEGEMGTARVEIEPFAIKTLRMGGTGVRETDFLERE